MRFVPLSRVRIPISAVLWALLLVVAVCSIAETSFGAEVNLLRYDADGYKTTFVYVNVTASPVELPGDGLVYGCMCVKPTIAAHDFREFPSSESGIGIVHLTLPDGIQAYSEIVTPHGVPVRIGSLVARDVSFVPNVYRAGRFNGGVVVVALTDSVVQVAGGEAFRLKAGEGRIANAPTPTTIVSNSWPGVGAPGVVSGKLYVVGFENDQENGAVLVVEAH